MVGPGGLRKYKRNRMIKDTPYNGSRLNGKATSGLEGRVPQLQIKLLTQLQKAFSFLLFWILSRLFPRFFLTVQAHEEEYQTSGFVGEENL